MTEVFNISSLKQNVDYLIYLFINSMPSVNFFIYQVEVHDVGKEMELDLIKQYSQVSH